MEYQMIKAIASFNERGEVQPLYFKLRHNDRDLTFKVVKSREVKTDSYTVDCRQFYDIIAQTEDFEIRLEIIFVRASSAWQLDKSQLSGVK